METDEKLKLKKTETEKFNGVVRSLREEDLPQIKPILETWVKDRDTGESLPEEVQEDLELMKDSINGENSRVYFIAEENGQVIGIMGMSLPGEKMRSFSTTGNPVELVNAFVASDRRQGRGVGSALVRRIEQEAKTDGFTEIILNSGPRYEDSGWGFYDRLEGYSRLGVAMKLYGEGGDAPVWHKVMK